MGSPGREHVAAGRRTIVKFYSLKRYATDESKALEMTAPLLPLPPQPSSTSAPPPRPSAATGSASRCRRATPAAATLGSSSARCRPTASVRSRRSRRNQGLGKPSEPERKGICLFTSTCSVVPDNSAGAVQRAATVLRSFTSVEGPLAGDPASASAWAPSHRFLGYFFKELLSRGAWTMGGFF